MMNKLDNFDLNDDPTDEDLRKIENELFDDLD